MNEESKEELLSISSSNSVSLSDENELRPKPKRAKTIPKRKTTYPVKVAHVPRRIFNHIHKRMKKNRPVIDLCTQTIEKSNCNRFILNQLQGTEMDIISPESITRLMWEMRECLQRKDYGNLARLISMFTEMPMGKARWYPTLIKYCLLVLLNDPLVLGTDLMDTFLEGVIGCHSETDKKKFLQDIKRLPTNIHVTKYDDLWSPYPLPNQLNEDTLDELCKLLNDKTEIKDEVESDVDSDWETYDENSSNYDTDDTTDPEIPCDLNDIINKLEDSISK